MSGKKKLYFLWVGFVVCVFSTIGLWFAMNNAELKYEEVDAIVLNSKTNQVVNKKNGTRTNFYKVEVEYEGKTYDLGNPHSATAYPKGKRIKAYLYNDKLYANIEGVKTSTPIAMYIYILKIVKLQ